jgi:hypothetical protein
VTAVPCTAKKCDEERKEGTRQNNVACSVLTCVPSPAMDRLERWSGRENGDLLKGTDAQRQDNVGFSCDRNSPSFAKIYDKTHKENQRWVVDLFSAFLAGVGVGGEQHMLNGYMRSQRATAHKPSTASSMPCWRQRIEWATTCTCAGSRWRYSYSAMGNGRGGCGSPGPKAM